MKAVGEWMSALMIVTALAGGARAQDAGAIREMVPPRATALPADIESFDRIAEIVDVDPEHKRLSRERYKVYRERGCALETHNL